MEKLAEYTLDLYVFASDELLYKLINLATQIYIYKHVAMTRAYQIHLANGYRRNCNNNYVELLAYVVYVTVYYMVASSLEYG